ncbi:MAG: 6-bladed beta-propeller [Bacteroidota bacterium]|nr:6-bladed beta-propeller [Bacteroidota bacterium]MXW14676.1 hypothetical protein [Rhodothermaceae bacterium]MXW33498.1 hypothetical protein [Rhodothermaceae bacterium]MYC04048.1 hypothetical protein [Rhodothermaceae bacterium]MYE63065.1 hypothetical protein [Rhodothermaceae bacterium]
MKQFFFLAACAFSVLSLCKTSDAQVNSSSYEFTEIYRVGDEARGDSILFVTHEDAEVAVNSTNHWFVGGYGESPVISFSDGGRFVGFLGAKGKGPGEFENSTSVIVGPGDSVYVFDSELSRLLVFEPTTLRYVRSINTPAPEENPSSPSRLLGVTDMGYMFRYRPLYRPPGSLLGGYDPNGARYSFVTLVDRQGITQQTSLAKLPARQRVVRTSGSSIAVMPLPFGRDPFFAYKDGLLYAGWNDAIDISIISESGERIRTVKIAHEASPVTQREIDAEVAKILSPRNRRSILRSKLLPETKPAYDALVVDDQGHIWIRKFSETDAEYTKWLIIGSDGTLLGEMELPANLLLKTIKAGRAYASIYSEEYGPYIVVYEVTKL